MVYGDVRGTGGTTMASVDRRQSVPAADKKRLGVMLSGLDPFVIIRQTMPLQYVRMFLLVAMDEGKGVNEYGQLAGGQPIGGLPPRPRPG